MSKRTQRETPLVFSSGLANGSEERKHDTLNLLPYAEALRDFIHECETPMTIGIQGEWGIGKTSLMNMLRGNPHLDSAGLLDEELCRIVNLETWPFSQFHDHNDLVIACLQSLTSQVATSLVRNADDAADLEATTERARSLLHRVLEQSGKHEMALKADGNSDIAMLMVSFHREFEAIVRSWVESDPARRIVVFVDDLDRVPADEALLLLEAFKHFVDIPGCVFVMAVDYDVIQQGMRQRFGKDMQRTNGKAYYDKIIQLPFVMPTTSYRMEQFLASVLQQSTLPFAQEMVNDEKSRQFVLDITLCTIGRNPRNIKRVMNFANLMDKVHDRQGDGHLDRREAQILYALICMQIAWPELYRHFVHDPSVDTVTSLQNWDYLDRLPEACQLFERESDREMVKINIGTFFDTLFSLLDDNDDGQIDSRELGPVLDVMSLASMLDGDTRERARDWLLRRVKENNVDNDPLVETFIERVFTRSVWYLGSECRYRKSGSRFVTLVRDGKQIGSLVSLRSQPFVMRLAMPPEKVRNGLKAYWKTKKKVNSDAITFTRAVFGKEASMTGFGDTVVDYSKMTTMKSDDAVSLLNALYRIAIDDTLPEWELPNSS